jgi:hypothetical protein
MTQQKIYCETLLAHGLPTDLANCASEILAKDDASKPNLGRTEEEKKVINQAWLHLSKPTRKE